MAIKSGPRHFVLACNLARLLGSWENQWSDLYGRNVGVVVGFSLRTNGDVESVGLDQGSGSFAEVKASRLLSHEQALIVIPMWKADVTRITGETGVLRKRISALRELESDSKANGDASSAQLEQMRAQYEVRVAKTEESSEKLLQEMRSRIEEIDRQDETLAKFLVNVNIQFRSWRDQRLVVRSNQRPLHGDEGKEREGAGGDHDRPRDVHAEGRGSAPDRGPGPRLRVVVERPEDPVTCRASTRGPS